MRLGFGEGRACRVWEWKEKGTRGPHARTHDAHIMHNETTRIIPLDHMPIY
jgi:hypothetical protein